MFTTNNVTLISIICWLPLLQPFQEFQKHWIVWMISFWFFKVAWGSYSEPWLNQVGAGSFLSPSLHPLSTLLRPRRPSSMNCIFQVPLPSVFGWFGIMGGTSRRSIWTSVSIAERPLLFQVHHLASQLFLSNYGGKWGIPSQKMQVGFCAHFLPVLKQWFTRMEVRG